MTDEITLDAPETRLERFLAAAAGVEGITLDEPVTRIEKYLYMIAQGGGSGGGVLVVTDTDGTLDKTWQEIHDADFAVIKVGESTYPVYSVYDTSGTYFVLSMKYQGGFVYSEYSASSASGYPTAV